jgi:L-serine dehydratase
MESIRELYKIGNGPSSSHTMGPAKAAKIFKEKNPTATKYEVTLYGSLAATGKGHLTDEVIKKMLSPIPCKIIFNEDIVYQYHPNGMELRAYLNDKLIDKWLTFSVGGGSLKNLNEERDSFSKEVYPHKSMNEILDYIAKNHLTLISYIKKFEDKDITSYMETIYETMISSIKRGLYKDGILPGGLNVERKASMFYAKYLENHSLETLVYAASLAVAEENASGGIIVTAPTCGSSGVLPPLIYAEETINNISHEKIIDGLLIAGLIGNVVKTNGSISGAEVGCQGEIGVACAMGAAFIAYIKNANDDCIEYAAEIALEHHLGMTCDPVAGLVQIPCIERNAMASMQAYNAANYASLTNGAHHISFDSVIEVMKQTGKDLNENYRETSKGGLAIKNIRSNYE